MLNDQITRQICQKIKAVTGAQSWQTLRDSLRLKPTMAKQIFRETATDFQFSLLAQIADQYGITFEYLTGMPSVRGRQLHPDAYMIAIVADNAFKRMSKTPELPSLTPHNIDGFMKSWAGMYTKIDGKTAK